MTTEAIPEPTVEVLQWIEMTLSGWASTESVGWSIAMNAALAALGPADGLRTAKEYARAYAQVMKMPVRRREELAVPWLLRLLDEGRVRRRRVRLAGRVVEYWALSA